MEFLRIDALVFPISTSTVNKNTLLLSSSLFTALAWVLPITLRYKISCTDFKPDVLLTRDFLTRHGPQAAETREILLLDAVAILNQMQIYWWESRSVEVLAADTRVFPYPPSGSLLNLVPNLQLRTDRITIEHA